MTFAPLPSIAPLKRRHFLIFAVIYLYAFPYFDKLRSAQETPRLLLTQEIVDRGVFYLDARLGEMGSRNDLSVGPDGHMYANKTPGPSFVATPAYLLAKTFGLTSMRHSMWAVRVGVSTLPALLFLPLFYGLAGRFTKDERARRAALAAYALASPALPYAQLLYAHQLAAVCLGGAFYFCVRACRDDLPQPEVAAFAGGVLAGFAPWMDYQAALASAVVGLYLLFRSRQRIHDALCFGAGALPGIAGLMAYHYVCFGSPVRISYGYGVDTAPEKGAMGFIGPNAEAFANTLFVPSNGLFVLMPWVFVSIVGAVAIFRDPERRRRFGPEALAASALVLVYAIFVGSMLPYMARGGWSAGPRQLVAMLPFAGLLAAVGFEVAGRRLVTRVLSFALVVASGIVFISVATTYPHWPDGLLNPLYELSFRLLRAGYAVTSIGTVFGLRGIWAILPLYVLAAATGLVLLARGWRRPVLVTALACVVGTGLVASYRYFPLTGPYANRVWTFVTSQWEPPH